VKRKDNGLCVGVVRIIRIGENFVVAIHINRKIFLLSIVSSLESLMEDPQFRSSQTCTNPCIFDQVHMFAPDISFDFNDRLRTTMDSDLGGVILTSAFFSSPLGSQSGSGGAQKTELTPIIVSRKCNLEYL
jgi:hypothetical protein